MNESISYRFFLGANSSQGFVSFFSNATSDPAIAHNYVFKGGPGCGKSTAMRRVVDEAAQRGLRREIIYCSSDPGSLDGALFPTIGAAVYDGTAPHTIELAFPGAEGSYVTPRLSRMPKLCKKKQPVCVRQMGNWAAIISRYSA